MSRLRFSLSARALNARRRRVGDAPACALIACIAIATQVSPAVAMTDETPDTVQVFARRERPESQVGSSVAIIDRARLIETQQAFLAEALREIAGVSIAQNGAGGGFSSARIRGGSSGQTLVVIDGVAANDPAAPQGGFDFSDFAAFDAARVEVLRGPQSLIWGADAIGGVISIETAAGGAPFAGYVEGGSFATVRGGVAVEAARGGDYLRASAHVQRTDGVSRAAAGVEADGFRSIGGGLAGALALDSTWTIEARARVSRATADIDGFPPPAFALADTAEESRTERASFTMRALHAGTASGALTLGYALTDRRDQDGAVETFTSKGDRFAADYVVEFPLSAAVTLIGGGAFAREEAVVSGVDAQADRGGAFVLAEIAPAPGLILAAGARRDEFSNFEGATTARISAAWRPTPEYIVRASWGEGYRAPSLFELNYDQFGVTPNPNLAPERAHGFDASVERLLSAGSVRIGAFQTRVNDQIDFDLALFGYYNVARARSRGVEAEANLRLGAATVIAAYAFTDARNLSLDARALRTPRHRATLAIDWRARPRLSVGGSLAFNGAEADSPAPNGSFTRLDLRARYEISERVEAYGRVENAADADYQDVSGYGEPGVAAFGGVRVRL